MRRISSLVLLLALAACADMQPPDPCTATPHSTQCQMERYTGTR
ncbi:hypothetical protein [Ramlibacter monticola]|nr:hypothetical protein [Ramlibacter monticola]